MSSNTDNSPDLEGIDFDSLPDADENSGDGPNAAGEGHSLEHQIELLESQLLEKEDLVFALTERLEQAAEQLDRYRRSGTKQGRGGGGGLPKEVVEEQRTLFEEMRNMIAQWEATQPGATLGRIELQVTELRDLVSGNLLGGGGGGGIGSALSSLAKTAPAAEKPKQEAAATPKYKPGSWEEQRAALMAGETPAPAAQAPDAQAVPQTEQAPADTDEPTEESADTPRPIDLETADIDQLREAVRERDRIIASLKEQIAEHEASGEVVKYDTMESMPDEFREKLEALEEEWKDKIRETEVELSLERAKIAREKAELQQQQHQMQKHREKLGLGAKTGASNGEAKGDEEAGSGRWLRFLKRSNDEE